MEFNDADFSRWEDCDGDCCANAGPAWSTDLVRQRGVSSFRPHARHPSKSLEPLVKILPKKRATTPSTEEFGSSESMIAALKQLAGAKSMSSLEKIALELTENSSTEAVNSTVALTTTELEWPPSNTLPLQPKDQALPWSQPLHSYRHADRKAPRRPKPRSLSIVSCRPVGVSTLEPNEPERDPLPQLSDTYEGIGQQQRGIDKPNNYISGPSPNRQQLVPSQKAWTRPEANTRDHPLCAVSNRQKNTTEPLRATKRTVSSHLKASDFKFGAFRRLSDATQALRSTTTKRFDSQYAFPDPTQRSANKSTL